MIRTALLLIAAFAALAFVALSGSQEAGAISRVWGDNDCSGAADPIDSLKVLRKDAGLDVTKVDPSCPDLGSEVTADGMTRIWGDINCSSSLDPIDSLGVLRFDAGLGVTKVDPSCPTAGASVELGGGVMLAIDTDPTGNTATSVGEVQTCNAIAAVGETLDIDIVVEGIPAFNPTSFSGGVSGFSLDLLFDESVVNVTAISYQELLLAASGSPAFFEVSDPLPDTDGSFRTDIADLSQNIESGSGVLVRITLEAVGAGTSALELGDAIGGDDEPDVIDGGAKNYGLGGFEGGTVVVGGACP